MAWSEKYKRKINCGHPRGFSQKAHCASKKKGKRKISVTAKRFDLNNDGQLTGADFKLKSKRFTPKTKSKMK